MVCAGARPLRRAQVFSTGLALFLTLQWVIASPRRTARARRSSSWCSRTALLERSWHAKFCARAARARTRRARP
eukprot:8114177-Alexandrium_andersonii.AAC.1